MLPLASRHRSANAESQVPEQNHPQFRKTSLSVPEQVIGIEIKSALSVRKEEFRGLRELRKLSGDAFLGGVVLYLGRRSYTYDDQLHVMPIDRLWSP